MVLMKEKLPEFICKHMERENSPQDLLENIAFGLVGIFLGKTPCQGINATGFIQVAVSFMFGRCRLNFARSL